MTTETLPIVAVYVGLCGLVLLWLGMHVGMVRRRLGVPTGDGGRIELVRAMRAQANFCEYVPLALLILLVMSGLGAPVYVLHLFGALLVAARVMHGLHFARGEAAPWLRQGGAGITALVILFGSLGIIVHALV